MSPGSNGVEDALLTTQAAKPFRALAGPLTATLRGGPTVTCTVALEAGSPGLAPSLPFQHVMSTD